jgi:hypothetical protein
MVKYICKYTNEKIFLIYTERITKGITIGFKKDKLYGEVIFLPPE